MYIAGAIGEESNAKTRFLRFEKLFLVWSINFQLSYLLGGDIVNVSVVQNYTVGTTRLSSRVEKIELQKPAESGY